MADLIQAEAIRAQHTKLTEQRDTLAALTKPLIEQIAELRDQITPALDKQRDLGNQIIELEHQLHEATDGEEGTPRDPIPLGDPTWADLQHEQASALIN